MITLGIESSCDETGVALVKDANKILSNVVSSSLKEHSKYGGVIPEIASRCQLEVISSVAAQAISKAKIKPSQIDLVSVTQGPGLPGSLLVGIAFAKALSLSLNKPLLGVDHVASHIYANILCHKDIKLPAAALVVSGGHTSLFYVKDFSHLVLLSETQDDACGEAFDKVAKIMGLGYPGGPLIEKLALGGNARKIKFSCSKTKDELDFSFSGIKTAVLYYLKTRKLTLALKKDVAASFQETVINTLTAKALLACKRKGVKQLLIGGGVAANKRLRQKFLQESSLAKVKCFFPEFSLCMDNAAMVAGLGAALYESGSRGGLNLDW